MITAIEDTQVDVAVRIEYVLTKSADEWPDIEIQQANLSQLLDNYKKSGKQKFTIIFTGDDPAEWHDFLSLCQFLKVNYKCILEISTNGTKGIIWWTKAARLLDQVNINAYYESLQKVKMRNLADYLYELNLLVSIYVFMDPNNFEECEEIVEFFKESRHDFPLYVNPILSSENKQYNEKQSSYLENHLKQVPDAEWLEYVLNTLTL
jgi:organic radical activating enzyme